MAADVVWSPVGPGGCGPARVYRRGLPRPAPPPTRLRLSHFRPFWPELTIMANFGQI